MLVPAFEAATLGESVAEPGEDAAERVDELHAVTSKAAQASASQAAACLVLREFEVHMDSHPFNSFSNLTPCHLYDARRATMVETF